MEFLNQKLCILLQILLSLLNFVPKSTIDSTVTLVQVTVIGLVLNKLQAITWANDDWVYWHMYASLGLRELMTKWYLCHEIADYWKFCKIMTWGEI